MYDVPSGYQRYSGLHMRLGTYMGGFQGEEEGRVKSFYFMSCKGLVPRTITSQAEGLFQVEEEEEEGWSLFGEVFLTSPCPVLTTKDGPKLKWFVLLFWTNRACPPYPFGVHEKPQRRRNEQVEKTFISIIMDIAVELQDCCGGCIQLILLIIAQDRICSNPPPPPRPPPPPHPEPPARKVKLDRSTPETLCMRFSCALMVSLFEEEVVVVVEAECVLRR
jgi:hypothetical protein